MASETREIQAQFYVLSKVLQVYPENSKKEELIKKADKYYSRLGGTGDK
jgi:hypothetical protein